MSTIVQVTANGEEHGLVNSFANEISADAMEKFNPKVKAELQKRQKENAKKVKVVYLNAYGASHRLQVPWAEFPGDPIQQYNLIPNFEYELPLGLVKHINELPAMTKRSEQMIDGQMTKQDSRGEKIHRLVAVSF